MRLFIAINFSDDTKKRLLQAIDIIILNSVKGNFTRTENLHLTLVFIGECPPKQLPAIQDVIDSVTFNPFTLTFDCLGKFAKDGGDICWIGLKMNNTLQLLQKALNNGLVSKGFFIEQRHYKPHITLGREVVLRTELGKIESFSQEANSIDLMKSEHINGKLVYTKIYSKKIM